MKDEKKKHSNEDLEWIYNQTFGHAIEFMKDVDVLDCRARKLSKSVNSSSWVPIS